MGARCRRFESCLPDAIKSQSPADISTVPQGAVFYCSGPPWVVRGSRGGEKRSPNPRSRAPNLTQKTFCGQPWVTCLVSNHCNSQGPRTAGPRQSTIRWCSVIDRQSPQVGESVRQDEDHFNPHTTHVHPFLVRREVWLVVSSPLRGQLNEQTMGFRGGVR